MTDRSLPEPSEFVAVSGSIDSLSDAVRASQGDREAVKSLWAGMFGLERWFFIPRGTSPNFTPYVGVIEGVPSLCAFTSPQRSQEFAQSIGLPEEEWRMALGIPTDHVAAWCASYTSNGVARIIVDPGHSGFFLPLGQLEAVRAEFGLDT